MWPDGLTKYVEHLERDRGQVKPLVWKRIGSRLETATILGLIYSLIEDDEKTGREFCCTVAGNILYRGDDKSAAKQAAKDDVVNRILDELVEPD